ncbi:MAG: TrbC/VirB2 family protein [Gammaproteobacteria bacterium]|nr:TrbC/VirB2 family protein [Gammaproteobacteria bacterium]
MSVRSQLLLLSLLLILPQFAFAADVISSFLDRIVEWLTGTPGKALATIALGAVFIVTMFTQHLDWRKALWVCVGVVGLIGSAQMYKWTVG